jgi:uncharacterized protein with HEPN domain
MTPRDADSIRQMLDHAEEVRQLTANRMRGDLDTDRLLQLAATRLLEIVGEAGGRISASTRDALPQIQWTQIVALRNRLIHGYDAVDCDIMWQIIRQDIPSLIIALRAIVAQLPS